MPDPTNRILTKMLDRLFAAIVGGPSLSCRPHSSRQRLDLLQLAKFADPSVTPAAAFAQLLGPDAKASISASISAPPPRRTSPKPNGSRFTPPASTPPLAD